MVNKTIGRFSALACADMVHITSYYKGTQYQYLMVKNGTKINIDLLATLPTKEHDGVEVKIQVNSLVNYRYSLKYIWFIPNVYVHDESENVGYDPSCLEVSKFNDRKLCLFKTFAYNNVDSKCLFVLLGNILYPIDLSYIPKELTDCNEDVNYICKKIIPRFDIGELDVTPNREQLLYSDRTKKALEARYKEAAQEIIGLLKKVTDKSIDNIFQYYETVRQSAIDIDLPNDADVIATITICKSSYSRNSYFSPYLNYKYRNGDPLADDKQVQEAIANLRLTKVGSLFRTVSIFEENSFYTSKQINGYSRYGRNMELREFVAKDNELRVIYVPTMQGLKSDIFKDYLTDKCSALNLSEKRVMFLFTPDRPSVRDFIKGCYFHVDTTDSPSKIDWHKSLWLLREIRRSMKGKVYVNDIVNSKDYVQYRANVLTERKEEKKRQGVQKFNTVTRFYIENYDKSQHYLLTGYKKDVYDIPSLISQVDYRGDKPVYWGVMSESYVDIWRRLAIGHRKFSLVTVAKTNAKCLERAKLPSNWVKITPELILNSKEFRCWITKKKYVVRPLDMTYDVMEASLGYKQMCNISKSVDWKIYDDALVNSHDFLELEAKYNGYYDQNMLAGYATIAKYNEITKSMQGILSLSWGRVNPLSLYVAMKRKLFRPSWEVYSQITQSLNQKPKEEEQDEENS